MYEFYDEIVDLLPYLSIPFVSALIGWSTNVIALKMTFYPLEYIGLRPFGWQGIIPANAKKMASLSVDLMTSKLVNIREVFANLDPQKISEKMKPESERITYTIVDQILTTQIPVIWRTLSPTKKAEIYQKILHRLPDTINGIISDIKENITELLDLKSLAISVIKEDKKLVNEIFFSVGKSEFKFIENSGFYFGFVFGIIQMVISAYYNPWWMLPVSGLVVGYLTNWLALKLIFYPINPYQLGGYTIQGIFLKRQHVVAVEYAEIITKKILTIEQLFDTIMRGDNKEKFSVLVKKHVDQLVEKMASGSPMYLFFKIEKKKLEIAKNIAHFRLLQEMPITIREAFPCIEESMDIKNLIINKMQKLSSHEFVDFLRPVFQEDETKLILAGAVLGLLAGVAQFVVMFA